MNIEELNKKLAPQGLRIFWVGVEGSPDYKMRPIPVDEKVKNLEDAFGTLTLLSQICHRENFNVCEGFPSAVNAKDSAELKQLFDFYGSDKGRVNDFNNLYSNLFDGSRFKKLSILEIGLGTNNLDVQSNMGREGKPGASLRAFRDYLPNSQISGADIDSRILFEESRIRTFHVDQTDIQSLRKLALRFNPFSFDLIIDDGLHRFIANVNSLFVALGMIKPTGKIVIEDISTEYIEWWRIVAAVLDVGYEVKIYIGKASSCAVISRIAHRHIGFDDPTR